MHGSFGRIALLIALVVSLLGAPIARTSAATENPFPRRQPVPPLPKNVAWLNTSAPIELKVLRGKFVLIDFWTYCCINCMHILPEIQKLEHAWPKNLVVIGVHSAKFTAEQDSGNITAAIKRYRIEHPVINDSQHVVWDFFGVESWPTVFLIDPEGNVVWRTSGEITADQVDKLIRGALPYYRKKGLLNETPTDFKKDDEKTTATPLRYPGKILFDPAGDRLFIADSNHNRIVAVRPDGTLIDRIGSGAVGTSDGDFASARFDQPQGMALKGNVLYVADTENHLIRRVDLQRRVVATVAGTGSQAREPLAPGQHRDPRRTPLSSPWDLCIHGDDLHIAMAGCHQIWRMRLDGASISLYAGNGREDIVDGPRLPQKPFQPGYASFAQPSGLATDGTWLYVADSEGSSMRRPVPLGSHGEVGTIVGTSKLPNNRLFTYGDVDGPPGTARFQHPLGLAFDGHLLYVADTYNNKIRVVDPATGTTSTLAGTGAEGRTDDPPTFNEPAGLAAAKGVLYVADTDNHLIRVIDLRTAKVSTVTLSGLGPP